MEFMFFGKSFFLLGFLLSEFENVRGFNFWQEFLLVGIWFWMSEI
jgi:hypothetical protein